MRILDESLIVAGNMSGNLSATVSLDHLGMYAIQCKHTGAGVDGTFKLQASNDNLTFTDIDGSSQAVLGAGDIMWNVDAPGYRFVKVVFTANGGSSGALTANVYAKGF